jgi:hypothetical protein
LQERARAAALGYPDPTNPNFEATSDQYHKTLTECLRRIKAFKDLGEEKKIAIMVASHNEDTVRFAIQKMKEFGIEPEDKVICFGQLLAMCDYITFPLGEDARVVGAGGEVCIVQVNPVIRRTSTSPTVRSTKCCPTCPGGPTRTRAYSRRSRRRRGSWPARSLGAWSPASGGTRPKETTLLCKREWRRWRAGAWHDGGSGGSRFFGTSRVLKE